MFSVVLGDDVIFNGQKAHELKNAEHSSML